MVDHAAVKAQLCRGMSGVVGQAIEDLDEPGAFSGLFAAHDRSRADDRQLLLEPHNRFVEVERVAGAADQSNAGRKEFAHPRGVALEPLGQVKLRPRFHGYGVDCAGRWIAKPPRRARCGVVRRPHRVPRRPLLATAAVGVDGALSGHLVADGHEHAILVGPERAAKARGVAPIASDEQTGVAVEVCALKRGEIDGIGGAGKAGAESVGIGKDQVERCPTTTGMAGDDAGLRLGDQAKPFLEKGNELLDEGAADRAVGWGIAESVVAPSSFAIQEDPDRLRDRASGFGCAQCRRGIGSGDVGRAEAADDIDRGPHAPREGEIVVAEGKHHASAQLVLAGKVL